MRGERSRRGEGEALGGRGCGSFVWVLYRVVFVSRSSRSAFTPDLFLLFFLLPSSTFLYLCSSLYTAAIYNGVFSASSSWTSACGRLGFLPPRRHSELTSRQNTPPMQKHGRRWSRLSSRHADQKSRLAFFDVMKGERRVNGLAFKGGDPDTAYSPTGNAEGSLVSDRARSLVMR